ncbi:MAG: PAS domain S-box protein, partial [Mucilaginibacter sp.]
MQSLIKSEEFFKTLDLIITPVILVNGEGRHQYFNKAFLSNIGYSIEYIPDKNAWFEKAYPDQNYRTEVIGNWEKCIETAKVNGDTHVHLMVRICCADGSFKWFDIHENTFGDNKVVTFMDVNELQESY